MKIALDPYMLRRVPLANLELVRGYLAKYGGVAG
jgi:hypothetical protein